MNYNDLNSNELLSHIAGSTQATALMERYESLTALARADESELMQIPGVGAAKAAALKSAFSLAQKLSQETTTEPPLLDTPERIANLLREELRLLTVETLVVVLLNTRRRLIKYVRISNGTLDTLLVHPREVFRPAIAANAAALALVHQHPSGNCEPSPADISTTRDLIRAGQLLKIEVVDHIILGARTTERPKDFFSLRENGFFYA
jgi:DNA repair protein RadC